MQPIKKIIAGRRFTAQEKLELGFVEHIID